MEELEGNGIRPPSMSRMGLPIQYLPPLCPLCHSDIPPIAVYELNGPGWVLVILLICFVPFGICVALIICLRNDRPDPCHDPVLRCPSCGAKQMMPMPIIVAI